MKARYLVASGIVATSIYAGVADSGGAWDNLPCGATEETAHVCIPGEVARDGTTPNPLPTPAPAPVPPEIVPATVPPDQSSVNVPAVTPLPEQPKQPEANKPPRRVNCIWLRSVRAGMNRLYKYRCIKRQKVTPKRGPFQPAVAGEYQSNASVSQGGYTYSALRPTRGMGVSGKATESKAPNAAKGGRLQVQLLRFGSVVVGQEFLVPKPNVTYTATVSTGSCGPGSATYVTRARIRFPSTGVVTRWSRSPGRVLPCG